MIQSILFFAVLAFGHHYKGLPHYSYFDNYPQVPILEFIGENPGYEIFVTVYNFQGLNLKEVDSPDDVRMYIYIHDLENDKSYRGDVDFSIFSDGKEMLTMKAVPQQQESLFIIQRKIENQGNLKLVAELRNAKSEFKRLSVPVSLKPSFLESYGLPVAVVVFFALVALVKLSIRQKDSSSVGRNGSAEATYES